MRRTLMLGVLVALGLVLVTLVEPPRRLTGRERSRGPRLFRAAAHEVRRVDLALPNRQLAAERAQDGWRLDGVLASAPLRDALDALVGELVELRAVDAFRPTSMASLGLEPPEASIVLTTARGSQHLALGALNAAGSTVYARRDRHGRVLQVGIYVVELVRRVFGARDLEGRAVRAY
jgi:hypothetical protein